MFDLANIINYICIPNSLAVLHITSVVTVHAAGDIETVGFSAVGVDNGQMYKEDVGCIDTRNKVDVNMR